MIKYSDRMAETQNINVSACHSAVDAMLYSTTFQQQMWFLSDHFN